VQFNIQLQWEINLGVLKVAVESGSKSAKVAISPPELISYLCWMSTSATRGLDIDISAEHVSRVAEVLLLPWHPSASREERNNMILSRSAGPTRLLISPSTIKKNRGNAHHNSSALRNSVLQLTALSQRNDGCESGAPLLFLLIPSDQAHSNQVDEPANCV
jgi:hypothetical protein